LYPVRANRKHHITITARCIYSVYLSNRKICGRSALGAQDWLVISAFIFKIFFSPTNIQLEMSACAVSVTVVRFKQNLECADRRQEISVAVCSVILALCYMHRHTDEQTGQHMPLMHRNAAMCHFP
jgi:hypothetical protein